MKYTIHIKARTGWFDIDFEELYKYKDLIWLFFVRNYSTMYKQTILGPLWLIINPMLSAGLYAVIFGYLAGLSTPDTPQFIFYLCSNAIWSFFSTCLIDTSKSFTSNANIMGKVYFPRLVMPLSAVLTGLLTFGIQVIILLFAMMYYSVSGYDFHVGICAFFAPIIVIQTGMLGLGVGIIIAALTTKYRDLVILINFCVQLWMYASPVVYTSNIVPESYKWILFINPMTAIIECWRYAVIGVGTFWKVEWLLSCGATFIILLIGVLLFSKIEKTFMDTV